MGKIQKHLDQLAMDGAAPSKRELAELGDRMLGGHKRRRKRGKVHRVGVASPTTKAKWKAGGKRQPVKLLTDEEKQAVARAMGLNTTA